MTAVVRLSKPCDECGGTGMDGSTYVPATHLTPSEVEPCYACHRGWLPDDETVEAGFIGFSQRVKQGTTGLADSIAAALVAAARYQSEGKP